LPVDRQWVYQGTEQGQTIGLQITVLDQTETLYSGRRKVTTRVVEEVEWEDANGNGVIDQGDNLLEISRNFFAQIQDGTVCYFGEEVDIYEGGWGRREPRRSMAGRRRRQRAGHLHAG
jgi:hypothetical protein